MHLFKQICLVLACLYICERLFSELIASKKPLYKIQFIGDGSIRPFSDSNYITCSLLFVYADDKMHTIPVGFVSDLASIPHWFWSFINPEYAPLMYPALIHDYLYSCPGNYSRRYADEVFYSAMISNGLSKYIASKMYWSVRLFGKPHFNEGNECKDTL